MVGRAAAPADRHRPDRDPAGARRRSLRLRRAVSEMLVVWLSLATVVVLALSMLFAADSRPGVEEPPQAWFGRR
jgi:hypothetical protein